MSLTEQIPHLDCGGGRGVNAKITGPGKWGGGRGVNSTGTEILKAPFPYFGGKSRIADEVWRRIGDVDNFIEPFAGTLAVLLRRPDSHKRRIETVNDLNCYLANFWRATKIDPENVAIHADWPVNEIDLHARHRWLVQSTEAVGFRERMRREPEHFDSRIAGWWVWGQCCWIGSGWCDHPEWEGRISAFAGDGEFGTGHGVNKSIPAARRPEISVGGMKGVNVPKPGNGVTRDGGRPQLADAYSRGRGVHGHDEAAICDIRRAWLLAWFKRLADRFRVVRVCCGDWLRVCDSTSVTTRLGLTGVFLDPPYRINLADGRESRDGTIYATDGGDVNAVVDAVLEYCLQRGRDPKMRIAVCGYEGEGYEVLDGLGWDCIAWKSNGGYANKAGSDKRENRKRERIWFSPNCQRGPVSLFAEAPA